VVVAVVAVADVAGCLEVALFAVGGDDCDCDCMAGGAFDPLKEEVEAVVGGLRAKRRAENLRARSWGAWSLSMAVVYRRTHKVRVCVCGKVCNLKERKRNKKRKRKKKQKFIYFPRVRSVPGVAGRRSHHHHHQDQVKPIKKRIIQTIPRWHQKQSHSVYKSAADIP